MFVSSDLRLVLASVTFRQQGTQRFQRVNTFWRNVFRFARKKPKFVLRKRKFEHSDYFLDYLLYEDNDRYNYEASFLYWSFVENPEKKDPL